MAAAHPAKRQYGPGRPPDPIWRNLGIPRHVAAVEFTDAG
jgi:hypothetical protein